MTVTLGKRRRDGDKLNRSRNSANDSEDDDKVARALFQRAFEAKFKPLKPETIDNDLAVDEKTVSSADDHYNEDNDAWSGIESEGEGPVEVIEFAAEHSGPDLAQLAEKRAFMSSKLPSQKKAIGQTKKAAVEDTEDSTDRLNLKHDIALQRLLKESHLLQGQANSTSELEVQGSARLKALDLRMQDLGSKTSHLEQKKMPMAHRKGINAKATERERKRRKEAAENGIVLERAKAAVKVAAPRERGIGGPNIGHFHGGMLKLSNKDVRSIESSRSSGMQKRRKGR